MQTAAPTSTGDESFSVAPISVDSLISQDMLHFSAPIDPVMGLSEKVCFLWLFLGRKRDIITFLFESSEESFLGLPKQ